LVFGGRRYGDYVLMLQRIKHSCFQRGVIWHEYNYFKPTPKKSRKRFCDFRNFYLIL
jgi:hypothetical protein